MPEVGLFAVGLPLTLGSVLIRDKRSDSLGLAADLSLESIAIGERVEERGEKFRLLALGGSARAPRAGFTQLGESLRRERRAAEIRLKRRAGLY